MIMNDQSIGEEYQGIPIEIDLCALLQTMNLSVADRNGESAKEVVPDMLRPDGRDVLMTTEDPNCLSDDASDYSSSGSSLSDESYGCAYLKVIKAQLDSYQTTGEEYLEVIFTHREMLSAFPDGHQQCARGFSDLAYMMERRVWRADRDADTEAVSAFRHEAWMIAATLPSPSKREFEPVSSESRRFACIMPVMY